MLTSLARKMDQALYYNELFVISLFIFPFMHDSAAWTLAGEVSGSVATSDTVHYFF
jgi:hypothetical protein